MSSGFHNFNSNIGNQVVGTLNIGSRRESDMAFIQQQLNAISDVLGRELANSRADAMIALHAIEDIRRELASKSPKTDILDRSLKAIDGISSVASLVGQIRSLLLGLL